MFRRTVFKVLFTWAATATGSAVLGRLELLGPTRARAQQYQRRSYSYAVRRTLARSFAGARIYALQLSEAEEEALLRVLVSHLSGLINPERAMNPPPESQDEAEIAAVIGAERAARFMQLRRYAPACSLSTHLRDELERAGAALTEAQSRELSEGILSDPNMEDTLPYDRSERWRVEHDAWWNETKRRFCELREQILTPLQQRVLREEEELVEVFQVGGPRWDAWLPQAPVSQTIFTPRPREERVASHDVALSDANKRAFARRYYGMDAAELGLSESELDALLTAIGAQLRRNLLRAEPLRTPEEDLAELAAVIGPEKAAEYHALREGDGARHDLLSMRDLLERHGAPPSEGQYRKLIDWQKQLRPGQASRWQSLRGPDSSGEESFLDGAGRSVLSGKQLRVLDEEVALRAAMLHGQ